MAEPLKPGPKVGLEGICMKPETKDQFDMVKMAEEANRKAKVAQEVPAGLQKRLVDEFKALMSPAYDNHSFETVVVRKNVIQRL
jgi:hypothetical protein